MTRQRPDPEGGPASGPPDGRDAAGRARELAELETTFDRLFPLLRSLTGEGVRQTHRILAELLPLETLEIPSGTPVFDWTVPREWVVREAYVVTPSGERILDVHEHTLHLVGYSIPFQGELSLEELSPHLYSLPERPDAIPYVTSYYRPRWGFCLPDRMRRALRPGTYRVVVDTELVQGSMTLSECVLPGESDREVLLTSYTCHPSMANNELSGPLVAAFLYRRLAAWPRRRLSYRFVLGPETIGAIAYLSLRGEHLKQTLDAGLVLTCLGDAGALTYKRTRRAGSLLDRAVEVALAGVPDLRRRDFVPLGSDERQYASPGFDLPVGSLTRSMYGTYPEYHTSDDDRSLMAFDALQGSVDAAEAVCRALDLGGRRFRNLSPYGEPQLGRRGLYPDIAVGASNHGAEAAIFWVLNLSDGDNDLLAIAERSAVPFDALVDAADRCVAAGLLEPLP